jgi:hypothetical protein
MAKVRVQVSLFDDPIEVEESEIPNLRTQGILVGAAGDTAGGATPVSDSGSGDGPGDAGEPDSGSGEQDGGQDETTVRRQRRTAAG